MSRVYVDPRDPPVRVNCAQCGKPRKPRRSRYSGDQAEHDPFCSHACCESWYLEHGLTTRETREDPADESADPPARVAQLPPDADYTDEQLQTIEWLLEHPDQLLNLDPLERLIPREAFGNQPRMVAR